jgi:hypothetical protein
MEGDSRTIDEDDVITAVRGLELSMPHQRDRRQRLKKNAFREVMEQQDRQRHPELIAQVYSGFSTHALNAARSIGIQDEKEAKHIAAPSSPASCSSSVAKKARRSVRFSTSVKVRRTLHRNNFTDEEIRNTWYKKKFKEFKSQNKKTVKAFISRTIKEDNDEVTIRGLECLIPRNAKVKKQNRVLATNAVLGEKNRQESVGEYDYELIARACNIVTYNCVSAAQKFAWADSRFALVYAAKDRNCWEKF